MFVIISKILFRIKKIYLIRQIRLPNLTIYEDKKMKLLESAKNLKKSCYIYFFDSKKKFNIITNMLRATKLVRGVTMPHCITTRFERLRDFP